MATATSLNGRGGRLNAYDAVAASATDSVLVTNGNADAKIRVIAFMVNQGDTTPSAVTFNSKGAGAGTSIFPPLKYPANGGTTTPECKSGWFETKKGESLTVSTGVGSVTGIAVVWEQVG